MYLNRISSQSIFRFWLEHEEISMPDCSKKSQT